MDERTMMPAVSWPLVLTISACLAGGVVMGILYFRALRVTADLIVSGERPLLAIAATLGRFALLGAGLTLALQAGAPGVLAALAGVLVGRRLAMRTVAGTAA